MSKEKKMITFELTTPFKYAMNGKDVEANHIDLAPPTGRVSHLCCEIESLIQSGLMSMAGMLSDDLIAEAKEEKESDKKDDKEDQTPEGILSIMNSSGVDMKKVVLTFRELFKEVALMGGEKKITTPRLDDMSHKDFKQMMGVYAANFIMN
jgi:hypothetical protein